eukprot:scaffold24891_cov65-Phaeocystis_antarctica.AAC.2
MLLLLSNQLPYSSKLRRLNGGSSARYDPTHSLAVREGIAVITRESMTVTTAHSANPNTNRLGRAAPGSGQGMPELVRTCRGSSGVQVQARAAGTACGANGAVMLWRRPGTDLDS